MTRRRRRRGLRPRVPALRGPPRPTRRGDAARSYKASIRRALGLRRSWRQKVAPFVLLGDRHDPGDRQRRHRATSPATSVRRRRADRDHHLPRVRRRVVRAAVVRRARRARRHVPRPAPARAAADVRPPADRRRLRGRQARRDRHRSCSRSRSCRRSCSSSGNMLVSDSALDYFTGHLDVLWKVPIAVLLLALYYAVVGVAISSLSDRRIVAGASIIGLFLVTSITSAVIVGDDDQFSGGSPAAAAQRARAPAGAARPRVPRAHRSASRRSTASSGGGALAIATYVAVLVLGLARPAAPLPVGGTLMASRPIPAAWTIRRSRPTRRSRSSDVSVWFGQKVALSELSCSFGAGVDGPARPERRGQDDADARDHRTRAGQPGYRAHRGTRSPAGPVGAQAAWRSCPRTKRSRPGSPPGSSCATSPTCTAFAEREAPDGALHTVGMLEAADRRVDTLQQGHAPAHQGRGRARERTRTCSCSTSRSTAPTRCSG